MADQIIKKRLIQFMVDINASKEIQQLVDAFEKEVQNKYEVGLGLTREVKIPYNNIDACPSCDWRHRYAMSHQMWSIDHPCKLTEQAFTKVFDRACYIFTSRKDPEEKLVCEI